MKNEISLPVFIACFIIPVGFIAPLMKLAFGSEQLTLIAANLKPIQEFLATKEQIRPEKPVHLDGSSYVFKDVSF